MVMLNNIYMHVIPFKVKAMIHLAHICYLDPISVSLFILNVTMLAN